MSVTNTELELIAQRVAHSEGKKWVPVDKDGHVIPKPQPDDKIGWENYNKLEAQCEQVRNQYRKKVNDIHELLQKSGYTITPR